jgi:hypothetical protein
MDQNREATSEPSEEPEFFSIVCNSANWMVKLYYEGTTRLEATCDNPNSLKLTWDHAKPFGEASHYAVVLKDPRKKENIVHSDRDGTQILKNKYSVDVTGLELWRYNVDLVAMMWAHHVPEGYDRGKNNANALTTTVACPMPDPAQNFPLGAYYLPTDFRNITFHWRTPWYPTAIESQMMEISVEGGDNTSLYTWHSPSNATSMVNLPVWKADLPQVTQDLSKTITSQSTRNRSLAQRMNVQGSETSLPTNGKKKIWVEPNLPPYVAPIAILDGIPYTGVTFTLPQKQLNDLQNGSAPLYLRCTVKTVWKKFNQKQVPPTKKVYSIFSLLPPPPLSDKAPTLLAVVIANGVLFELKTKTEEPFAKIELLNVLDTSFSVDLGIKPCLRMAWNFQLEGKILRPGRYLLRATDDNNKIHYSNIFDFVHPKFKAVVTENDYSFNVHYEVTAADLKEHGSKKSVLCNFHWIRTITTEKHPRPGTPVLLNCSSRYEATAVPFTVKTGMNINRAKSPTSTAGDVFVIYLNYNEYDVNNRERYYAVVPGKGKICWYDVESFREHFVVKNGQSSAIDAKDACDNFKNPVEF